MEVSQLVSFGVCTGKQHPDIISGEYDPQYESIVNATAIPTFPKTSPNRWSVLVDSIVVGAKQVLVTTNVASAPGNKAVALLDSGTSYSFVQIDIFYCLSDVNTLRRYAPPEVCNAIYGGVSGAKYDSSLGQWVVPCDAEIDMALQIKLVHVVSFRHILTQYMHSNEVYPLHPLDVSPTSLIDSSTCVGSFLPQAVSVGQNELYAVKVSFVC